MKTKITIKTFINEITELLVTNCTNYIHTCVYIIVNNEYYINRFKNKLVWLYDFFQLLSIYLIEKYYYKFNFVYFVLKANRSRKIFNFFTTLNTLKEKFVFTKPEPTLAFKIFYYYFIMFIALIVYVPITFFLLRVNTDPQNWMLHYFDDMNFCNLL